MNLQQWLNRTWHQRLHQPFRLAYTTFGRGTQPILLLHGLACDRTFWNPLIAQLDPEQYTVIVPDLLGHGQSPSPGYINYSSADQAQAVAALCGQLGVDKCVVVGHSMGCLVATRLATQQPSLVERLLLYEPPLFADVPEFRTHQRRRAFYFGIYERIAQIPPGGVLMTRMLSRVAKKWARHLANEQTWLPIERSLRNSIMQPHGFEELRDTTVLTDIVHGRFDVVVPRSGLKKMLAHNKNIRFYRTTDRHGMSKLSARHLAKIIASPIQPADNEGVEEE